MGVWSLAAAAAAGQFLAPGSVHRGMLVRGRRRREHSLETRNKAAQRLHNQVCGNRTYRNYIMQRPFEQ